MSTFLPLKLLELLRFVFEFSFLCRLSGGRILYHDVRIDEYMDIYCPQFDTDTPEEKMLQFVIYNTSEEAFAECDMKKGNGSFVSLTLTSPPDDLTHY